MVEQVGRAKLLAPLEDELAEGEVNIDGDTEEVVPMKHPPTFPVVAQAGEVLGS